MNALRLRTESTQLHIQGVTISRTLRPLAASAMVALIGMTSAGCGSNAASETATATSTGADSSARTAGATGAGGHKNATDQDEIASSSSAGLALDGVVAGAGDAGAEGVLAVNATLTHMEQT